MQTRSTEDVRVHLSEVIDDTLGGLGPIVVTSYRKEFAVALTEELWAELIQVVPRDPAAGAVVELAHRDRLGEAWSNVRKGRTVRLKRWQDTIIFAPYSWFMEASSAQCAS